MSTVNPHDQRKRELEAAQAAFARMMIARENGQRDKGKSKNRRKKGRRR